MLGRPVERVTRRPPAGLEGLRERLAAVAGLSELFKALADETRTRVLVALEEGELCVHDLAGLLGMSLPAVSHHLRLLRAARLVRARREGKHVIYRLHDGHVVALIRQALEHFHHDGRSAD